MKKNLLPYVLILSGVIVAFSPSAKAAVMLVNSGDIAGNSFAFSILSGESGGNTSLASYGAGTGVALVSNSSFQYLNEQDSGQTNYLWASGGAGSSASIILGWDFSSSGYRPTSVSVKNITVDFSNAASWELSISTDGVNYTPYASYSEFLNTNTYDVAISGNPDMVYIKAAATNVGAFPQTEWGRSSAVPTPGDAFTATFSVVAVPEPSSTLPVILGVMGGVFLMRRKNLRIHP